MVVNIDMQTLCSQQNIDYLWQDWVLALISQ